MHDEPFDIHNSQAQEIQLYLKNEFYRECQDYPHVSPGYDGNAALWAAKIVYHAALFIVFRKKTEESLELYFPLFTGIVGASQILSADLILRFLPFLYHTLENINPEDAVLNKLERILETWHYSAIDVLNKPGILDLKAYFSNSCLLQLFLNRIVEQENHSWASHPEINQKLIQHLGYYKDDLWSSLTATTIKNESE